MVVIAGERRRVAMYDQCRWAPRVPPFTARTAVYRALLARCSAIIN
jgi:hypothetical protein